VTFLFNAIEFLGNAGQAITSESLKPGEAITARLPSNATDITLRVPNDGVNTEGAAENPGAVERLNSSDPTQLAWGPIRRAGIYSLAWKQGADSFTRDFAANLLSESEGRIATSPTVVVGQERVDSRDSAGNAYTPLWPWAIGVCLAVLMFEWWVYHRKAYI
jgi:hypothetical protein